jgi:hypothetical protein
MADKLEDKASFQMTQEEALKLRDEGRLRFLSFGKDPTFFAILDKKEYYRKSESGVYYSLKL